MENVNNSSDLRKCIEAFLKVCEQGHLLSKEMLMSISVSTILRKELIRYFEINQHRQFTTVLLDGFVTLRKEPENEIGIEDLMLACYLLGQHNQVEDCLKIWEAKEADFDSYCGVDIQLMMFTGVDKAIAFLESQTSELAQRALKYVKDCDKAGDFTELDTYFNEEPWWL
jgi:hypothetical protein